MKTGIQQGQFVAHRDYSSTANCPTKKIQDTSRNIWNFSRYFQNFYVFFPTIFRRTRFGNTALNTIKRLVIKMKMGVFSVTLEPNLYVI